MKLWIVSRIDEPSGWPVFDSAWADQEEAVAYMLRMKTDTDSAEATIAFPRYFIGLKVDSKDGTEQPVTAPVRRGVPVAVARPPRADRAVAAQTC